MNVICQGCGGTGYVTSTSRHGGDGLYRCHVCKATGQMTLDEATVRDVLRQVAETYVPAGRHDGA